MRDIALEENGNISLEAKNTAVAATVDNDEDMEAEETDDITLADICEVVISLKCKQCQFLCHDKVTLANHIKQNHVRKTASEIKRKAVRNSAISAKDNKHKGTHAREKLQPSKETPENCPETNGKSKKKKEPSSWDAVAPEIDHSSQESSLQSPDKSQEDIALPVESILDESVEDVFLCAECDIVFSSREMCCSHMHKVHGLKQFSSDFIQEEIISKPPEEAQNSKKGRKTKFPRQYSADSGTIVPKKYRVTKDIFHICSRCPMKFESADVMKFHEQCHLCPSDIDKFSLGMIKQEVGEDVQIPEVGNQKGFMCPVCENNGTGSQIFPKWGPCSWHLWKEHRIDCELYTCTVCKQFKSHLIARVKDHEQLHSTKASYKCKTCNKTFKQMKQLRCHEKYHKDNSTKLAPEADSRWYTPKECPICKRILSDSKCLKKHISAVHNKLKPYVCNICGHTSARKAELKLHVRQHTGEKPYTCPLCPFQTGDHNSLRKHKLRHSDERPYACPYCDYRCIQSCAFKKHILAVHPGQEVVFLCQLCSHASVNEILFAAHQKDHAEGRIAIENQTESESTNKQSPSPSTSQDSNTNESTWSADEDSLDIIDNGGVTIPASPPPESNSQTDRTEQSNQNLISSEVQQTCTLSIQPQNSFSHATINGTQSLIRPRNETASLKLKPSFSGKGLKKTKESIEPQSLLNGKLSFLQPERRLLSSQGLCLSPTTLPSVPSPRQEKATISIVPSSATNEDTESSTSEVITNPHQLIQNIQLTPLDLTEIISEQSNDDGMLQKLLDMSGV